MHRLVHPDVAVTINNMGSICHALSDYNKTIDFYQQALAIIHAAQDENQSRLGTNFYNLCMVYFKLGEKEQAKDYLAKAYEIGNQCFGSQHAK
jgi:tetratricopeptide (TPR) repeat protein